MDKQDPRKQSPWLLCNYSYEDEQLFCHGFDIQRKHIRRIPILKNKKIWNYTYGWILLKSESSYRFMLFNPDTRQTVYLPVILSKPRQNIIGGILWLPPENLKSMVLLIDSGRKTIWYCNIHNKQWVEISYWKQVAKIATNKQNPTLLQPFICNGRLYALVLSRVYEVVEIEIDEQSGVQIKQLGCEIPFIFTKTNRHKFFVMEYEGDLFAIDVAVSGVNEKEIIDVGIFKWIFYSSENKRQWKRVKANEIKETAFFLSGIGRPICISCTEAEGGRVHILINDDGWPITLSSFNVEEGSITLSIPVKSSIARLWITASYVSERKGEAKGSMRKEDKDKAKVKKITSYSQALDPKCESTGFNFLSHDIIEEISKKLMPLDYMNFRATCKTCYQAAPVIKWRDSSLVREQPQSLLPMLMFSKSHPAEVHHFLDPKFNNIFTINIHDELIVNAQLRYSNYGWVLMNSMNNGRLFFFYNPFMREMIEIPEAPELSVLCETLCFSHPPSSSECVVVGIAPYNIFCFSMGEQQWTHLDYDIEEFPHDHLTIHNTPVFVNRAFYFLGTKGSLSRLTLEDHHHPKLTTFRRLHCPCEDFYKNFLLEWDGGLASVFIDSTLTKLEIFRLNEKTFVWEEISSLGKHSVFLSCFSAFSAVTNFSEMEDKIYLSKICGENNVLFYSLKTRKYGYNYGISGKKLDNFDGTKEYLFSLWIEPSFIH